MFPQWLRKLRAGKRPKHRLTHHRFRPSLELLEYRLVPSGGDFSLDFVAAAPLTYNHATGGGAYDDRTIGRDKDVVESLEGGDFKCGEIVTYLVAITVDAPATRPAQTIDIGF